MKISEKLAKAIADIETNKVVLQEIVKEVQLLEEQLMMRYDNWEDEEWCD